MNGQVKIDQMFAYIVMDDDNTEGIAAFQTRGGWMPMVGADMTRVDSLRTVAQQIAKVGGKKLTLVKFSQREELEVIE